MRYCPSCLEEFEDNATTCTDCEQQLVTEEELAKRPEFRRIRGEEDTTDFVVVAPAEDPFDADAFTTAIDQAGIPVFARMRRSGSVDALTVSAQRPWWEILVPSDDREKALELVEKTKKELAELEEGAGEAAAEEEELETEEKPV